MQAMVIASVTGKIFQKHSPPSPPLPLIRRSWEGGDGLHRIAGASCCLAFVILSVPLIHDVDDLMSRGNGLFL